MKQKTTIQKVKDIIEVENISKKEALEGILTNFSLLEIMEEEPNLLVIRASDYDCFTIPNSIIKASQRLHLSLLVSYRYLVEETAGVDTYPVLVIRY